MAHRKTILVVDDIELNRAILCELFQKDYALLEAADGAEALALIERHAEEIAIVLLDVVMPVMGGIEVLRRLSGSGLLEQIPVILVSGENNAETALEGYTMGVADIVEKPIHPDIVRRRVENVIRLYAHKSDLEGKLQEQYSALQRQSKRLEQMNGFVIDTLSTVVEFRDSDSGSHVQNIRRITKRLLTALSDRYEKYRLSQEQIGLISDAAALHDIGKISIPDAVLLKPGRLTDEEFELMKTHTLRGCDILSKLGYDKQDGYYRICYDICRHHHERWDGRGYPDGLAGDAIPLSAQVVSLADVYEALVSKRVYKEAYSHDQAVDMILNGACGCFNPELLRAFREVSDTLREEQAADGEAEIIPPDYRPETLSERTYRLLELERRKCRLLAGLAGEIVFDYDPAQDIITFSERFQEELGRELQFTGLSERLADTQTIYGPDKQGLWRALRGMNPRRTAVRAEIRLATRTGRYEWFQADVRSIWAGDREAECVGVVGKLTNIQSAKQECETPEGPSRLDPLTGLCTGGWAAELIDGELKRGASGALLVLDLDYFREINGSHGRTYGDEVLRQVARRMKALLRDTDVVGRLRDDRFVVFLRGAREPEGLRKKTDQLLSGIQEAGRELNDRSALSCSIGVACCPRDGYSFPSLLQSASRAVYRAKQSGKNRVLFCSEEELRPEGA